MDNLFIVLVTYNPSKKHLQNIFKLSRLFDNLIVIDNTHEREIDLPEVLNFDFLPQGKNIGLSKALNIGIKTALEHKKCDYILLMDQDSVISLDNIMEMLTILKDSKYDVIGPNYTKNINLIKNQGSDNIGVMEVSTIITSGSLTSREVFNEVGLMDETLFIDYIDYEWCLRAKYKGYKIGIAKHLSMYHELGSRQITFFGIKKPIHNNAMRQYYIVRNNLILVARSYVPFHLRVKHAFKLIYRLIGYPLFSNSKLKTIRAIFFGIKDFICNYKTYRNYKY